ncbi:MAG: PepSY-like domain-containing protein [Flavobacteriales bacterium]|nr:PepSY-like domain-containing protein [Flavobacteriales bacterium]
MRTLITLILLLVLTPFSVAQKAAIKAPATAVAHLTSNYPGAAVKEWKQGSKNWKAGFKLKGEEYDAYYTPAGAWVRTEHNIPKSELPAAVTTALKANKYDSWKIDDVEEHATPEQPKLYKVKVETEVKKAELFFTPDGKLLREEEQAK